MTNDSSLVHIMLWVLSDGLSVVTGIRFYIVVFAKRKWQEGYNVVREYFLEDVGIGRDVSHLLRQSPGFQIQLLAWFVVLVLFFSFFFLT